MKAKNKVEKKIEAEETPLIKSGMDLIGQLSPRDYWEWRTTVTEVEVERLKASVAELKFQALQKDLENSQLKMQIFRLTALKDSSDQFKTVKTGADKWKESLEGRLGFKLSGCIIDDVTFEVKRLEDEPKAVLSN